MSRRVRNKKVEFGFRPRRPDFIGEESVNVRLTAEAAANIDSMVSQGKLGSRADAVRYAIDRLFIEVKDPGLRLAEALLEPPIKSLGPAQDL